MKRRTVIVIGVIACPLVLFSMGLFVWIPAVACYWQLYRGIPLEKDLGFSHGSPYVKIENSQWGTEVMTLERIDPSGIFAQAGIKEGDIPLDDLSITEFYRMLERSRGKEVTIMVVPGGDGPALNERLVRTVTFKVPDAK
jgi:hypothetical protein